MVANAPTRRRFPASPDIGDSNMMAEGTHKTPLSQQTRRHIDDVFGDVLANTPAEEREPTTAWRTSDTWYLENRPPHHEC